MRTSTLVCIVLLCSAASAQAPKWTNVDNWRLKLEPYMTTHQVRLLLGEPIDREVSMIAQIWYYEKGPTRQVQLEAARQERQALLEERRLPAEEYPAEEPENLLSKYLYTIGTITITLAAVVFLKNATCNWQVKLPLVSNY
jgi:hypothetical protein